MHLGPASARVRGSAVKLMHPGAIPRSGEPGATTVKLATACCRILGLDARYTDETQPTHLPTDWPANSPTDQPSIDWQAASGGLAVAATGTPTGCLAFGEQPTCPAPNSFQSTPVNSCICCRKLRNQPAPVNSCSKRVARQRQRQSAAHSDRSQFRSSYVAHRTPRAGPAVKLGMAGWLVRWTVGRLVGCYFVLGTQEAQQPGRQASQPPSDALKRLQLAS
jgi:hypothetical protein